MNANAVTFLEYDSRNDTQPSPHQHVCLVPRFKVDNTCPGKILTDFGYYGHLF
jgi:hypothetical protein